MKNEFDKINKRLENIDKSIVSIDKTLIKQHSQLSDHIRRTEMLELEIGPLKKQMYMAQGAGALIFILSLIATIFLVFK